MKYLEVLGWTLLAFLGASSMLAFRPMPLDNDSYQYLSVAENFNHGRGLKTSLVYFEIERSHGRIPAPITTLAPGYPVVIAALSRFGADPESAGRAVSCLGFSATAALLAWALMLIGVPAFQRQAVLLLFATNAYALKYATWVMSESFYMMLSTAAIVVLIWAERDALPNRQVIARAVLAYSLAGLACWVRYAGFFLVAGLVSYAALQSILHRNRLSPNTVHLTNFAVSSPH